MIVFGWTGGKQLVSSSYVDAKEQVAERREEHKRKREEQKTEKMRRVTAAPADEPEP